MNTYDITQKDIKQLCNQIKASAKRRGIYFDLKPTDIDEIGIPITCPVLGIPIHFHRGEPKPDSISFDRINSSKGYTKDNIVIVSYRANQLKSNATLTEMENLVRFYREIENNT